MRIDPGQQYRRLLITPDGTKLYAINESAVDIFGVGDLRHKRTLRLPRTYRSASMARDGRRIYLSSPDGGIMVVDTIADRVLDTVLPIPQPVFDIAVTPDNRKLFLAMGNAGLRVLDLNTKETRVVSSFACPVSLDLDRSGKNLYVAFECSGAGGWAGHNTDEIYDVDTEKASERSTAFRLSVHVPYSPPTTRRY